MAAGPVYWSEHFAAHESVRPPSQRTSMYFTSSYLLAATRGLRGIDYLVVLIYLGAVMGAGVFFSRQQQKSEDYFVAGRRMPWFAVGLSLVASLLSTLTYLGTPGELIKNGVAQAIGWLTIPFSFAWISLMWLPFFMRLGLTSVYEYLAKRFGPTARRLGRLHIHLSGA